MTVIRQGKMRRTDAKRFVRHVGFEMSYQEEPTLLICRSFQKMKSVGKKQELTKHTNIVFGLKTDIPMKITAFTVLHTDSTEMKYKSTFL